jgi:hypothetical protein
VVERGPSRVAQVDGEKLNDEEVGIRPARPHTGVGFAVILDGVVRRPKAFWETRVMHVALEHFGPWPLGAEAVPLPIIVPTTTQVMHAVLRMRPLLPSVRLTVCRRLVVSTRVA